ncbi:MAG: von Willebrand factor type A domain-containing protein [Planctomycetaceae bacterium]
MSIDPQDPKLTAYVLGELTEDERREVARLLVDSPAAQEVVEQLRQTSEELFAALAAESPTTVSSSGHLRTVVREAVGKSPAAQALVVEAAPQPVRPTSPSGSSGRMALGATVAALGLAVCLSLMSAPSESPVAQVVLTDGLSSELDDLVRISDREDLLGLTDSTTTARAMIVLSDGVVVDDVTYLSSGLSLTSPEQLAELEKRSQVNEQLASRVDSFSLAYRLSEQKQPESTPSSSFAAVTYPVQPQQHNASAAPSVPLEWEQAQLNWSDGRWGISPSSTTTYSRGANLATGSLSADERLLRRAQGVTPYYVTPQSQRWLFETPEQLGTKVYPVGDLVMEATGQLDESVRVVPQQMDPNIYAGRLFRVTGADASSQQRMAEQTAGEAELPQIRSSMGDVSESSLARTESERARYRAVQEQEVREGVEAKGFQGVDRFGRTSGESYAPIIENGFLRPVDAPYSTFSIDVDTASYANVRRMLQSGQLPPANAVRLEELVNAFSYELPQPEGDTPFTVTIDAGSCPWQPEHELVRVAMQAKAIPMEERPPASLVFLIDVSGSMRSENKLPLVQQSLLMLTKEMREDDQVSIVTYSNNANVVLDCANGAEHEQIEQAIAQLSASGSTNGEHGLSLAYDVARKHLLKSGSNRVLICTDGDFNDGVSDDQGVFELIEEQRNQGVFLSVLGFGSGNLKDSKLEELADKGNGQYSYIDSLREARRVLIEEMTGTLYTLAKDVKFQVEFNPDKVSRYRLLGYENRALADQHFSDDRIDAGELGAGHSVTALYEIAPVGAKTPQGTVEPRRYGPMTRTEALVEQHREEVAAKLPHESEMMLVKVRYKAPDADESTRVEFPYVPGEKVKPSTDLSFAAATIELGLLLRDSTYKGKGNWDQLVSLTQDSIGDDPKGRRTEFLDLVLRARSLSQRQNGSTPQSPTPRLLGSSDARKMAGCDGKYSDLLDKWDAANDQLTYGEFYDLGFRNSPEHGEKQGLPAGYWVYVYPNWYIWGERVID